MTQPTLSQDPPDIDILVQEIEKMMSAYIPDFEQKFSANFKEAAINEVREEKSFEIRTARALVFGETGVGKTTTINYLLDSPIFPTSGELSCTKSLACGEHEGGLIFYDSPGLGDEEGLENVTRTVLGIEPLEDEPIDSITLIDITAQNEEGPADYTPLAYDAFADEISPEFYAARQDHIVGKKFNLAAFQRWAADHFDFFVFVASSNRGLPTPIAKIIQAFDRRQKTLFKVFNVFNGQFRDNIDDLPPAVRNKFEQAIERSHKYNLTGPDDWLMIDSRTGDGVAALIKSFAEALPLDVLRSLNQVVKQQYTHLIEQKIDAYFFDYTAHIAALMAIFPVDHSEQGERFLKFTLDSIVTMARFMFAGHGDIFGTRLVDEMIDELEFSKKRTKITPPVSRKKKDSFLLKIVDRMGKNLNPDFDAYDKFDAYEPDEKPTEGEVYFAVGGVDAIQLILGLGLTLQHLYRQETRSELSVTELDSLLEANRRLVEANMGYRMRSKIIEVTRLAGNRTAQADKLTMASELFAYVRPLTAIEEE